MSRGAVGLAGLATLSLLTLPLRAQLVDSARVGPKPAPISDSLNVPLAGAPRPPVTPTKALFQSLLVPGWGQASLDRGTSGAIFVTIEVISVAMLVQSEAEYHAAQHAARVPLWNVDQNQFVPNPMTTVLSKRAEAVEDWAVLIVFNHLISAADAFVAAQLWNVPIEIHGSPAQKQAVISTQLRW